VDRSIVLLRISKSKAGLSDLRLSQTRVPLGLQDVLVVAVGTAGPLAFRIVRAFLAIGLGDRLVVLKTA
jgi:hypothetical protein